jgi:hypothetical protein
MANSKALLPLGPTGRTFVLEHGGSITESQAKMVEAKFGLKPTIRNPRRSRQKLLGSDARELSFSGSWTRFSEAYAMTMDLVRENTVTGAAVNTRQVRHENRLRQIAKAKAVRANKSDRPKTPPPPPHEQQVPQADEPMYVETPSSSRYRIPQAGFFLMLRKPPHHHNTLLS